MDSQSLELQFDKIVYEKNIFAFQKFVENHPEFLMRQDISLGGTALGKAASYDFIEAIKYMIGLGIDPNIKEVRDFRRPISDASTGGNLEIVRYLLDLDVILDTHASISNPLFSCVPGYVTDRHPVHGSDTPPENYLEIARLLLDKGIDYNVRYNTETMTNMDAMAFACMWGRQDIARLIAERKADGDAEAIERLMEEAEAVALGNTEPVPEGETVRPS